MDCQTALTASAANPQADRGTLAETFGAAIARVVTTLLDWQERAGQRRQLAALDPHGLKDVGLDPADACREALKPFWRP